MSHEEVLKMMEETGRLKSAEKSMFDVEAMKCII